MSEGTAPAGARASSPWARPSSGALAQRTIGAPVTLAGNGLHTGAPVQMRLEAGAPGSGIVFLRRDRPGAPPIRASLDTVKDTRRGVTLGEDDETVATVEHLLSAAAGMGIDNFRVAVDGPELPALDGSAAGFVRALEEAGAVEQKVAARVIDLGVVEVTEGRGRAVTRPASEFGVTYTVELPPPLGIQVASADLQAYREEVAPARTWGFAAEAGALRARGLARGATLDNALVIGAGGYLTPPRFPDEPARHKILDLIGDLALLGARLRGHVEVVSGGHSLHVALARAIEERWGTAGSPRREAVMDKEGPLEAAQILNILPHRYPFLLIDRILEVGENRIVGIKNVTINEPFFAGHIPGQPVMPGVLIVEAMAQVTACLIQNRPSLRGRLAYFAGIDRCRFRRPVLPGDTLRIEVEMRALRGRIGKSWAVASVGGEVAAEAEITFALPEEGPTGGAEGTAE